MASEGADHWLHTLLSAGEGSEVDNGGDTVTTMTSAAKRAVGECLDTPAQPVPVEELFTFSDLETGYTIDNIETRVLASDEIQERYGEKAIADIHECTFVSMNVFDGDGQSVGEYSRLILITKKGQIFIEHDNAGLQVTGTGFGARFQAATEDKYRELGVNAIFRGCGQFVGRYEGARSEFDFRDENMRSIFAQAFCAYLQENGVESVSIDSESGISVQDLPSRITIPQDMLKVTADRSVIAIKMERKDRAKEPPREFQTVIEHKKTYPADKAGKAFFLDEGSEAKKNIDPTVDYRQHSVGKWFGIKRLT